MGKLELIEVAWLQGRHIPQAAVTGHHIGRHTLSTGLIETPFTKSLKQHEPLGAHVRRGQALSPLTSALGSAFQHRTGTRC